MADSGATAWGGGHGSSAAGIYGASSWRAGTGARAHAVAAHARAAARRRTGRGGRMPWRRMHGWRCAGGGGRKRRGGAQAAGGGVGRRVKGRVRRERKRKLGLCVNSTVVIGCTNLKHWKIEEKKNFRKIYRIGAVTQLQPTRYWASSSSAVCLRPDLGLPAFPLLARAHITGSLDIRTILSTVPLKIILFSRQQT